MTPQNVDTYAQEDGGIFIEWDEVLEFDCTAEAPYADDCYAYVIEIDPYCCDYNWDGICEGEYQDCINGGGDDYSNNNDRIYESGDLNNREIIQFNQYVFDEIQNREIVGYYVFRDGGFLSSTSETSYLDLDIQGGIEYCYSVSVIYENSQSEQSDESCATSILTDFIPGDVNLDETIDILDIVIMVNMIFGLEDPNYVIADINDDGVINVLDVIIVINTILDE